MCGGDAEVRGWAGARVEGGRVPGREGVQLRLRKQHAEGYVGQGSACVHDRVCVRFSTRLRWRFIAIDRTSRRHLDTRYTGISGSLLACVPGRGAFYLSLTHASWQSAGATWRADPGAARDARSRNERRVGGGRSRWRAVDASDLFIRALSTICIRSRFLDTARVDSSSFRGVVFL